MTTSIRFLTAAALMATFGIAAPTTVQAQSSTVATAPSPRSTVKPFSLRNNRNKGVKVTVSWQIELPYKKEDIDDQLKTVEKGRRAFYEAIKRECDMLRESLASECTLATMRVSNSARKLRSSNSTQYISGSATFKLKLKHE